MARLAKNLWTWSPQHHPCPSRGPAGPQGGTLFSLDSYCCPDEDGDGGKTGLVQHAIDTSSSPPNCLEPHRLALVKVDGSCGSDRAFRQPMGSTGHPVGRGGLFAEEALDYITGSSWFSFLDLRSTYC
ncbi:unnamed protein product [Merluccius merluccius]